MNPAPSNSKPTISFKKSYATINYREFYTGIKHCIRGNYIMNLEYCAGNKTYGLISYIENQKVQEAYRNKFQKAI